MISSNVTSTESSKERPAKVTEGAEGERDAQVEGGADENGEKMRNANAATQKKGRERVRGQHSTSS